MSRPKRASLCLVLSPTGRRVYDLDMIALCRPWLLLSVPVALLAGCGSTNYLPTAPGDFDLRTDAAGVVVLENGAPEIQDYQRIGMALAKAKKEIDAIQKCREIAAENGGDGIVMPESKGEKDWKCTVLRRKTGKIKD